MCKYIHIKYACLWPGPKLHKELCECCIRLFRIFFPYTLLSSLSPTPSVNPYLNILKKTFMSVQRSCQENKLKGQHTKGKRLFNILFFLFYFVLFYLSVACCLYYLPSLPVCLSKSRSCSLTAWAGSHFLFLTVRFWQKVFACIHLHTEICQRNTQESCN